MEINTDQCSSCAFSPVFSPTQGCTFTQFPWTVPLKRKEAGWFVWDIKKHLQNCLYICTQQLRDVVFVVLLYFWLQYEWLWKFLQDVSRHQHFSVFSRAEEAPGRLGQKEGKCYPSIPVLWTMMQLLPLIYASKYCIGWCNFITIFFSKHKALLFESNSGAVIEEKALVLSPEDFFYFMNL